MYIYKNIWIYLLYDTEILHKHNVDISLQLVFVHFFVPAIIFIKLCIQLVLNLKAIEINY